MNMMNMAGFFEIHCSWVHHKTLVQELAGSHVSSLLHPVLADELPTYHRLNKFTRAFQVINDAYGVACYKEVNPGKTFLWTTCTQSDPCNEHPTNTLFILFQVLVVLVPKQ